VRPVVVESLRKRSKRACCSARVAGRRPRGFGLQRRMHALVSTILLRCPGIDVLQADAELDPMHRQPRQPRQRSRGEGRAIVAAHRARQAELAKSLVDDRLHRRDGLRDDAALDQKTAVGIGNGQRITALAIGGAARTISGASLQRLVPAPPMASAVIR